MRNQHFMTKDDRFTQASAADPFSRQGRRLDESSGINEAMVAMAHMAKAGAVLKQLGLHEAFNHLTAAAKSISKSYGR